MAMIQITSGTRVFGAVKWRKDAGKVRVRHMSPAVVWPVL